jgi:hypothetical protein
MSALESSSADLRSLSLGLVLGPVVALANQQAIYAVNMWACGRGLRATIHVVPVLALIIIVGTGLGAYRNWREVGRGVEDEQAGVAARTRFLALLGIAISIFSALVILAQWLAIFVFEPCLRA